MVLHDEFELALLVAELLALLDDVTRARDVVEQQRTICVVVTAHDATQALDLVEES